MKKTRVFSVLGVLVLSFGMVLNASAALPGSGWWTSFQVQNVDTGAATLSYTAYWQEGQGGGNASTTYVQSGTISLAQGAAVIYNPGLSPNYPAGSRIGFATADGNLPSGFAGGVELSSDKQVRAVVQVGNNATGSVGVVGGKASAFYQGTQGSDVGSSILFPVMKYNFGTQSTTFFIQAAGGAATINATFRVGATSYPINAISIAAGKTYLLDPAAASVPLGSLGSLLVTATSGQIAGVVVETPHSTTPATFALSTRGFGPGDYDTTIYAPTNKIGYFGGNTGWQIANTTGVTATANVTFTVTGVQAGSAAATAGIKSGFQYVRTISIPADGFYLFGVGNGNYYGTSPLTSTIPLTSGVFFAGVAVSDQPIVATVNENNGANRAVYSAFPASRATSKLAAPLYKEAFSSATTGLAIQNVGTADTTVDLSFVCASGANTYQLSAWPIKAGAAVSFIRMSTASTWGSVVVPTGNNCAVTATSLNGQPIVGLAQESNPTVDTKNYEAFNLIP